MTARTMAFHEDTIMQDLDLKDERLLAQYVLEHGLPDVHEDAGFAQAAFDAGGLGYVVKARLASDLLPAIQEALADRRFVSPTLRLDEARMTFPDPPNNPTPRKQ